MRFIENKKGLIKLDNKLEDSGTKEYNVNNFKCPNCGNSKTFYREISIHAKLKVNNKGQDLKTIYDIDKTNIDGYYEDYFYCAKCDEPIFDRMGS